MNKLYFWKELEFKTCEKIIKTFTTWRVSYIFLYYSDATGIRVLRTVYHTHVSNSIILSVEGKKKNHFVQLIVECKKYYHKLFYSMNFSPGIINTSITASYAIQGPSQKEFPSLEKKLL